MCVKVNLLLASMFFVVLQKLHRGEEIPTFPREAEELGYRRQETG